jgi:hypothetical protein
MDKQEIVVIHTGDPTAENNNLFNKESYKFSRYIWFWNYLYDECLKRGITLITSDVYLRMPEPRPKALLFVTAIKLSRQAKRDLLNNSTLKPVVFDLCEGPLYGCFLYWNLKHFSARFDHIFMPRGAQPLVSKKSVFHPHIEPLPYDRAIKVSGGFHARKYLTLINTNTRINPWKSLFVRVAQMIRPLPSFIPKELYIDRLRAIDYFSRSGKMFDLYGRHWNDPIPYASKKIDAMFRESITRSYRGTVDDKMATLRNYKFAICFENTIFGGYFTEKIFDAMFSGCLPVYWGAPDIGDFIPENTFIDFRKFKNYVELDEYLSSMDEATYDQYIENINKFLQSEQYHMLSQERFAEVIIPICKSYTL